MFHKEALPDFLISWSKGYVDNNLQIDEIKRYVSKTLKIKYPHGLNMNINSMDLTLPYKIAE